MTASNPPPTWRAWIEVDLGALQANARALAQGAGAPLLPVVKADGYGLGALQTIRALAPLNPWGYAVATVDEAIQLRQGRVTGPILMLSPLLEAEVAGCLSFDVRPTVGDLAALEAWISASDAPFHIEIDTGLGRAGFQWHDSEVLGSLRTRLESARGWEGAWCQYHSADTDSGTARAQWDRLNDAIAAIGRRPKLVHAANSAGGLTPGCGGDLARPGIYLYGGSVGGHWPAPVVSFRARVVAVRRLRQGDSVSYGATWTAQRATTIATIAAGYADGIPPGLAGRGQVAIAGRPCPIVGRVAMDMTMVDVGDLSVTTGETATFIGGPISLDGQAVAAGTTSYDLLTGIGRRVLRSYREPV